MFNVCNQKISFDERLLNSLYQPTQNELDSVHKLFDVQEHGLYNDCHITCLATMYCIKVSQEVAHNKLSNLRVWKITLHFVYIE